MPIGFLMSVDQGLIDRLKTADTAISQLAKTANNTKDSVVKAFQDMGNLGIQQFLDKLTTAKTALSDFGNVSIKNNGLNNISIQATKAVDSIIQVTNAMAKSNPQNDMGLGNINRRIDEFLKLLSKAQSDIVLYKSAIGTGKKTYIEFGQSGLKEAEKAALKLMSQIQALDNAYKTLSTRPPILGQSDFSYDQQMQRMREFYKQQEIESKNRAKREEEAQKQQAKAEAERKKQQEKAENDRYQNWLRLKNAETTRSKKAEDEKYKATQNRIQQQNALFAKKSAESAADEKRYLAWLKFKDEERKLHESVEQAKVRATESAISRQNKEFQRQTQIQNEEAKKRSLLYQQEYNERLSIYSKMFADIDAKEKQLAQKRMQEEMALRSKLGAISSASAGRLIGVTSNTKNVVQEELAIKKLTEAKKRLNKNDADYQQTMARLDAAIARHKRNLEESTRTVQQNTEAYERRKRAVQDQWRSSNADRAIKYSQQEAKTINDQIKAINYLKQARNNLDKSSMSSTQYEQTIKRINNEIRRQQTEVDKLTNKTKSAHTSLMNTAGQLQRQLAAVFSVSAIKSYISKLVQIRGEFELQQKSLEVLLQSKDKADALWEKTVQLAVKSPFTIRELVTYTKQLAAYRVESDKLYETNKMLADVSAGIGADMGRLILAYGQVKAANFLRGTELRQFSEAGVNMLGELAKLYTEVEQRSVSVGEVFERVSKRAVLFSDVHKVFERITSEGGIFYQMQEKQSATLRGQIMNLKDSLDLMYNSIGEANEGVLKNAVAIVKSLIDNWRVFATVLKMVGAGMATMVFAKFVAGWKAVSIAGTTATASLQGVGLAAAKTRLAFVALGDAIKSHPIIAIATAILAAGYALWEYNDAINETNQKYDKLSATEVRRLDTLKNLDSQVKDNNKNIKEYANGLAKLSKGTDEYVQKASELRQAQAKNLAVLETLKQDYPLLYATVKKTTDGIVDLTKALEMQQKIASTQIIINEQMKGSWFNEDFKTDYAETVKASADLNIHIDKIKAGAIAAGVQLEKMRQAGTITQEEFDQYEKYRKAITDATDPTQIKEYYKELQKAEGVFGKIRDFFGGGILNQTKTEIQNLGVEVRMLDYYQNELNETWGETEKVITDVAPYIGNAIKSMYDTSTDAGKKAAGDQIDIFLETMGIIDKQLKEWARDAIVKEIQVDVIFDSKTDGELEDWQKRVADAMNKVNTKMLSLYGTGKISQYQNLPLPESGQSMEQYQNLIKSRIEDNKKIANSHKDQQLYKQQEVRDAKELVDLYREAGEIVNITEKTREKSTARGNKKDWWSEMAKNLPNLRKEFIELNKTLNSIDAKKMVVQRYSGVFDEIQSHLSGEAAQISIPDIEFETEDGAIEALEYFKSILPADATNARLAIEKALSDIKGQVFIEENKSATEQMLKRLNGMFENYEMTIELDKLNIPHDLAERLFGAKSTSLGEIRDAITKEIAKTDATDAINELEKLLDKLDELETKSIEDRLKKYTKYLNQSFSELGKIYVNGADQILEIEKTYKDALEKLAKDNGIPIEVALTTPKGKELKEWREKAIQGVQKETQESVDKQAWDAFKSSAMYEQLFSDIEHLGTEAIKALITRLKALKIELKNLPPDVYKSIQGSIDKLEALLIEDNPFKAYKDALKNVKKYEKEETYEKDGKTLKGRSAIETRMADSQAAVDKLNQQIGVLEAYEKHQGNINKMKEDGLIFSEEDLKWAKETLQTEGALGNLIDQRNKKQKAINTDAEKLDEYTKLEKSTEVATKLTSAWGGEIKKIISSVDSLLDAFGLAEDSTARIWVNFTMGLVDSIVSAVTLQLQLELLGVQAKILGIQMNSALGIIGWIATALQVVVQLLVAVFQTHDKSLQRQIDDLKANVDELQKSWENLKDTIDGVFSSTQLRDDMEELRRYNAQMIADYTKMINLEEQKKGTDDEKIKEYKDAIEDLRKEQEELEKETMESFGATYNVREATREFVDAWDDAFKETGKGLDGLREHFRETFTNILAEQAVMTGAGAIMQPLFDEINKSLAEDYTITDQEYANIDEKQREQLKKLDEFLTGYYERYGDIVENQDSLSGLQKGIQGITEEQADIIAAFLSSIRFYIAQDNQNLTRLTEFLVGNDTQNPMLSQLKIIAAQTSAINSLLEGVTKGGHSQGGRGIKVFIN